MVKPMPVSKTRSPDRPAARSPLSTIRDQIAQLLFGDVIKAAVKAALAAVSIRIDDSPGWDGHLAGPSDRSWHELKDDLDDALEAWRKNFIVHRIVTLTRSYVVGGGITITSKDPDVDKFVRSFWSHPQNRIDRRLGPM